MNIRMWCEFLKPEDVCRDYVIDIFKQYNIILNFKLEYDNFTEEFFEMLRIYNENGIPVSIWATLNDEMGYWVNEYNVDIFGDYVHKLVDILGKRRIKVYGLCIDMEPPYNQVMKMYNSRSIFDKIAFFSTLATRNLNKDRYNYAKHKFSEIAVFLKSHGLESYAPAARETYYDVLCSTDFIQNALETPLYDIPWDKYNLMYYGTMMRKQIRKYDKNDIDYLIYTQIKLLKERFNDRISVSAGLTNTGKLGTEPYYEDMEDFYRDIGVLKACNVQDISIFSLDGILDPARLEMFIKGAYEAKPYTPDVSEKVLLDQKRKTGYMNIAKAYYKLF